MPTTYRDGQPAVEHEAAEPPPVEEQPKPDEPEPEPEPAPEPPRPATPPKRR